MENNAQAWAEVFCTSWSLKSLCMCRGCNTEKVGGPNWDSSIALKAPQCGVVYAVPQSQIHSISSGPEFSDYEEPNREHSQHINPGDEKRVRR